jgi:hypothetical protein
MKFPEALTALIDQQYEQSKGYLYHLGLPNRDEIAVGDTNVRIAYEVLGEGGLSDEFYGEDGVLDFGTFDNCREYGVTVAVGGWTFAVFEHRNSDEICVEGCPTDQVREYGPYGADDKHDVLFAARWKHYDEVAKALIVIARHALANPDAEREDFKWVAAGTQVSA